MTARQRFVSPVRLMTDDGPVEAATLRERYPYADLSDLASACAKVACTSPQDVEIEMIESHNARVLAEARVEQKARGGMGDPRKWPGNEPPPSLYSCLGGPTPAELAARAAVGVPCVVGTMGAGTPVCELLADLAGWRANPLPHGCFTK
jgi:hypothetical protein